MFTIYKKVTSPETSPLLGPAKSPDIKPTDPNPTDPDAIPPLESFSLCDCCSQRSKDINANANANAIMKSTESEYEFNHATHYKCNKTTPRLVWYEFYDTCN
jgi:hypothetical protein